MSFLQPLLLVGAAAGGPADHHPPDQPAAIPDDPLGGDDVPAGGEPDVARLCPAPAVADHGVPDGGDRRPDLRRQPAARRRLARAGGRRPARHDDRPARPLAEHAAGGAGGGGSKLETGPAAAGRTLETLGSARWVLIESGTNTAARARVDRRAARRRPAPSRPARRPTSPAMLAGGPRLHQGEQGRADRGLDLLRPPRERLERRRRPLAGAARRVPRVPAGGPVPPARLSRSRRPATSRSG